ncbi:MAG: hypothetical protein Q4A05_11155, partial [Ruminococcus sp.]|nr:hypothetical protein [Ruminococcus sp.]
GICTTAISFLDVADFEQIGTKISDFFNNLDVHGISADLTILLMKIWTSATETLNTFFEKTDWFKLGSDLFEGIGDGAREAEKENSGASSIIGSTLKLLKNIELAVYKFIAGSVAGLMKHIAKCVDDKNKLVLDTVKEKLEKVSEKFTKLREDIEKVWENIGEWFGDRFSEARKAIEDKFSSIGTWFSERRAAIEEHFLNIGSWFGERFKAARDSIEKKFEDIGSWFGERFQAARDNIERKFEDIGEWFGKRWDDIKEGPFGKVGSWFEERFETAYENITEGVWEELPDYFAGIWEGVLDETTYGLNRILGKVEGFANRIGNAFGELAGTSKIANSLVGKVFNSDISIPRLAVGGLAKAPTLAMVGDNRNAYSDPEVIAPLSKLQGMMGSDNTEVVELLRLIVELLRSGISAELIGNMFGSDFKRTVLRIVAEDNARRG